MVDNKANDFEIFINNILDNTGKIALKYFRDIKDLSLKRDMSPVTKADKEIEKYIRTQILNHYPNHNLSLIHISSPRDIPLSRMPSSA